MALETITSKHRDFQQISIYIPRFVVVTGDSVSVRQAVGEEIYGDWVELDRLLVGFLELHAVRPRIVYDAAVGWCKRVGELLPEMTARGIIELDTPQ